MTVLLRGVAWDHPRGLGPARATAARFSQLDPSVLVRWEARSIRDFAYQGLDTLARHYDLLLIDHPHIGAFADQATVLRPLDDLLDPAFLADQRAHSVGPSHRSYSWQGHQWALAVDAAAQVSAVRPDLLGDDPVPRSWDEVTELARALPGRTALPMDPIDAACNLLSLGTNLAGPAFWDPAHGFDREALGVALGTLDELVALADPRSPWLNAPMTLDLMAHTDDLVYVPLVFGYVNYALAGSARRVAFAAMPSFTAEPRGSVLGGVGLAISASSAVPDKAAAYAGFVADPATQSGLYLAAAGQPGHRSAWESADANRYCLGSLAATLPTLDAAFLRPRAAEHPEANAVQARVGEALAEGLRTGRRLTALADDVLQLSRPARD